MGIAGEGVRQVDAKVLPGLDGGKLVDVNRVGAYFLTYQCIQDRVIPVFSHCHCQQNRSHIVAYVR